MNTQVIEFLTKNPNSNKAAISEATGIKSGLPLFNLLKQMMKDGQIVSSGEGTEATYTIALPQTEEVAADIQPTIEQPMSKAENEEMSVADEQVNKEGQPTSADEEKNDEVKSDEQQEATAAKVTSGRDNTKYSLNGEGQYGKGPLVVKILEAYLKKNPSTTYKQLKEAFPDTLMKRFGVFEEISKAKEISGKRDRYFMKAEHVLKTGDKKQIVACSQWTGTLIVPLIECSRKLGMKIKPA